MTRHDFSSRTVTYAEARERLALTDAGMLRAISSGDLRVERQADGTWFTEGLLTEFLETRKARQAALDSIELLLGQGD